MNEATPDIKQYRVQYMWKLDDSMAYSHPGWQDCRLHIALEDARREYEYTRDDSLKDRHYTRLVTWPLIDVVESNYPGDEVRGVQSQSEPTSPAHYSRLKPEPIDVISDWGLGFDLGCAVKYIARAGHKDPAKYAEDLEKARIYLAHSIKVWNAAKEKNGTK